MIENVCLCCGKKLRLECSIIEMLYVDDVICLDCRNKMGYYPKTIKIGKYKVRGLYPYQGFVRDMMIQYKEYNDEALKSIFLYKIINKLKKKYKGYVLVPVPSSDKSLEARGFNQVVEMFSYLGLPIRRVLEKKDDISQKQQSYKERKEIGKHLLVKDIGLIDGKSVLLVDDILTTGSSLKACLRLLEPYCKKMSVVVVCYNKTYLNEFDKLIKNINF